MKTTFLVDNREQQTLKCTEQICLYSRTLMGRKAAVVATERTCYKLHKSVSQQEISIGPLAARIKSHSSCLPHRLATCGREPEIKQRLQLK